MVRSCWILIAEPTVVVISRVVGQRPLWVCAAQICRDVEHWLKGTCSWIVIDRRRTSRRHGFGVPSTFGGVIPTPTVDRIANEGLRYNRVFSTALCSPTRAALINDPYC